MTGRGFFVTGTDTGCGKTEISLALMRLLQRQGRLVLGMKPVASGARLTPQGLRNEDALRLQAQGSVRADYATLNPFAFAPPVAPHIAAAQIGVRIDPEGIETSYTRLSQAADVIIVEGVGGWKVPLGPSHDMAEIALRLEVPVILVVGLRLGCLNHALLSAESIRASGARLAAWVANTLDPEMPERSANIATLRARLACPCLGVVPWLADVNTATLSQHLQWRL